MARFKPVAFEIRAVTRRAEKQGFPLTRKEFEKELDHHFERKKRMAIHSKFSRLKREIAATFFLPRQRYVARMVDRLLARPVILKLIESEPAHDSRQKFIEEVIQNGLNGLVRRKAAKTTGQARQVLRKDLQNIYQRMNKLLNFSTMDYFRIKKHKDQPLSGEAIGIIKLGMINTFATSREILKMMSRELERKD